MASLAPRTRETLEGLEAALASAALPARIARQCEDLADKLRRPVRVGLIGFAAGPRKRLLGALLGAEVLPAQLAWPTVEIGFAERAHTRATLADASTLAMDGLPRPDLLERDPVFLRIGAPFEALRRVTFLHLAACEDADEQAAALRWAARRLDFALWCTRDFSALEARIWSEAAPELKNHAYLLVFDPQSGAALRSDRTPADFGRVIVLPDGRSSEMAEAAQRLLGHLAADIDEALDEDLDAARILLHRCGRAGAAPMPVEGGDPAPAPVPASEPDPGLATEDRPLPAEAGGRDTGTPGMVSLLSEPLIYLRRSARDLFEAMEWLDAGEDWSEEVLDRCCEVTDGLRDRAADWPEDEDGVLALRTFVEDASDTATLLRIEGGPEQALDAAALLVQLRSVFEARLPRPALSLN